MPEEGAVEWWHESAAAARPFGEKWKEEICISPQRFVQQRPRRTKGLRVRVERAEQPQLRLAGRREVGSKQPAHQARLGRAQGRARAPPHAEAAGRLEEAAFRA